MLPDDIDALAVPVLAHRLIPANRLSSSGSSASAALMSDTVQRIVAATPVPLGAIDPV